MLIIPVDTFHHLSVIIPLYWTSETLFSSSITTSKYLICDKVLLYYLLWQPLITKTNDYTSGKSLRVDIKWEVHKRTQQGVSAKLESYIYRIHIVHATSSYLSHFLLKATMLYTYVLMSSSRSFYYVLGLWCHIMCRKNKSCFRSS